MASHSGSISGRQVSEEELKKDVEAYIASGGNKSAAAKARGLPRKTYADRLTVAESKLGITLGRVADGRIEQADHEQRELPAEGEVARYVMTSVQNNTYLHPGWINLKAYADFLEAEFLVGTYSYALDAYGAKSVKRGSWKPDAEGPWYAPEIEEFINDAQVELAPSLFWCGQMNILPTVNNPLSGYETYNGRASNIIPHAKVAQVSIPSMPDEGTKMNWSTGTITQRNYIQKNAGIKAESGHTYAGVLVEVTSTGDWFVRHLHIDGNGAVYDVGPSTTKPGHVIKVAGGEVREVTGAVESITWADIHVAEMEPWVRDLGWTAPSIPPSLLDALHPRYQIMHDIFSMRSRGHHEMKDFHRMFAKSVRGVDKVEDEAEQCAAFLTDASRPWCTTVIVPSNHDRHLSRWLNEEDPRKDLRNARYHIHLQGAYLAAVEAGDRTFNILQYALEEKGLPKKGFRWLLEDESFVLCKDVDGGIEQGLHGDRGPGGSRGSTRGLTRLGRAVTKGHDHTATIINDVYSVGACSLSFEYMKGPSAHSITHCVCFENGRRQMITMWDGKWRA